MGVLFEISIVCHVLCSWLVGGWRFSGCLLFCAWLSFPFWWLRGLGVLPGSFVGVGCLPGFFSVIDLVVGGLGVSCLVFFSLRCLLLGGGGLGVSCLASFCGGLGVGWGLFSICLAAAFWLWFCLESLILAQDERWRRA